MIKILVLADGSAYGQRAVAHVAKLFAQDAQLDVHLLNVQIPVESGHVRMFVSHDELQDYYREEGLAALKDACDAMDKAGLPYHSHIAVGHVVDTILRYITELGFDKVVMGTHGRNRLAELLLGSVATELVKRSPVPVTLVKADK